MTDSLHELLSAFLPYVVVLMLAVALVYVLFAHAPLLFSAFIAIRHGRNMKRRLLFVGTVMAVTYGFIVLFLTAVAVPVGAFMIFVVPALRSIGYFEESLFLAAVHFIVSWWWLLVQPVLFISALLCTRYLAPKWNRIVAALNG